jgi:hypothetical protein
MFFLVGRVLGKRRQGLFGPTPAGVGGEEGLEFGYCFDVSSRCRHFSADPDADVSQVSIRAYLPIWAFLYILQFLFLPLIAPDIAVSNFFGNTMYLAALSYYFIITFLGYNGKRRALARLGINSLTVLSSPILKPNGNLALANPGIIGHLVHQPVHV